MPVPTSIADLSTTAASNSPSGSEARSSADDYLRTYASFIRALSAEATIASAGTITPSAVASVYSVTGTTTITSIASTNSWTGRQIVLVFAAALTLTYNASTLILPGATSITTAAGDVAIMECNGTNSWRCLAYTKANGKQVAAALSGTTMDATGNATVGGTLGVTGATTLSSTLGVTGAATLSSTLAVTGNATFSAAIFGPNRNASSGTAALSDAGGSFVMNSSLVAAHTFTIPPNSSVAFPIGTVILVASGNSAAQSVTLTRGAGVELIGTSGADANRSAGSGVAILLKVDTDSWRTNVA